MRLEGSRLATTIFGTFSTKASCFSLLDSSDENCDTARRVWLQRQLNRSHVVWFFAGRVDSLSSADVISGVAALGRGQLHSSISGTTSLSPLTACCFSP